MDRWRALALRTKVVAIIGVLILFIALMPDPDSDPAEVSATGRTSDVDTEEAPPNSPSSPTPDPEPELAVVPNVQAVQVNRARAQLRRADLALRIVRRPSWKPAGLVIAQRTSAGSEVSPGRIITLVVAAPMPLIPVLAGASQAVGVAALKQAGFTIRVVKEVVTSGTNGAILRLVPAGGTRAAPGSEVQVVVSNVVRPVAAPAPAPSNCTPGYSPCLVPASDYDCEGGSGDGPRYTGLVRVTGSDPYGLDADGDGIACES